MDDIGKQIERIDIVRTNMVGQSLFVLWLKSDRQDCPTLSMQMPTVLAEYFRLLWRNSQ